jgi:vacuolar-type H+-ATPase subunit H
MSELAKVEEGKSLLPEIVKKEFELEKKIEEAKAEARRKLDAAKRAGEERKKAREKDLPAAEEAYFEEKAKAFDAKVADIRAAGKKEVEALQGRAAPRVGEAAAAAVAIVLGGGEKGSEPAVKRAQMKV